MSDGDVAKVGNIASDSRGHRSVRRWASDHHHVWRFRHGSTTPSANAGAFSHARDEACESPFNQNDRSGDRNCNTCARHVDYAVHVNPVRMRRIERTMLHCVNKL